MNQRCDKLPRGNLSHSQHRLFNLNSARINCNEGLKGRARAKHCQSILTDQKSYPVRRSIALKPISLYPSAKRRHKPAMKS